MKNYNRAFFDEYTKLDNLCRQMFNSSKGVTQYIESMESTSYKKRCNIPDWDSDLKMLKQYRHIRNNLAHTPGEFHRDICVQYDITWIQLFYERITKRKDPLALLFKQSNIHNGNKKPIVISKKKRRKKKNSILSDNMRTLLLVGIAIIAIVIIIWINTKT